MDDLDIFEGWPQEFIEQYKAAPSPWVYDALNDMVFLSHAGYSPLDHSDVEYEERNVFDETTGQYKKEFIAHYGTPRHSGRYPWGSGKNPQRNRNWISRADDLAKQGLSQKEIAEVFGMSTGEYRAMRSNYKYQIEAANRSQAMKWKDEGHANTWIAERLGVSEGTVRNYLDPRKKQREYVAANVADALKETLKDKPYLDIGEGVNRQLGISEEQMKKARMILEDEGYKIIDYKLPQVNNPTQKTNMLVLCDDPEMTKGHLREHLGEVTSPDGIYFEDYGSTLVKRKPVENVDSSRVAVNYAENGGAEKDGVIEIRPGLEDISLGGRNYAQVRIGVDGTHYLKGMAVYGDPSKMPEGVDLVFNTNKHEGTPMMGDGDATVLKKMKNDPQNPFGASFRQWDYQDENGNSHTSPVNIVNDDEDWAGWKKNLSSQFLSKQPAPLIKQQLDIRYSEFNDEFEELKSVTNPTLRREMLGEFADKCDSAAAHLQAAALPRQGAFAILPVPSLKDNEVYAPMYNSGEEVVLVRHPHAGTFELPRLIVNNDSQEGKNVIGEQAAHAIGINSKVASQLSGADYDGDTVLVIPTKNQKIVTRPPLDDLKDFNPTEMYARDPESGKCTGKSRDGMIGDKFNKGQEMGKISNLITDMTIKGAGEDEIARAVKHSMVVIDAEKHNLDWQQSEYDNNIAELRLKWQGKESGGASTIISRSGAEARVPEREEVPVYKMSAEEKERWDRGEKVYRETNKSHRVDKKITNPDDMTPEELERYNAGRDVWRNTGKVKANQTKGEAMDFVEDAHELSSGTYKEDLYAAHANRLKALANEARKEERSTGLLTQNKTARETYDDVVGRDGTLAKKIALAELEAPKERQAQAIATSIMDAKIKANPELKEKDYADKRKKLAAKALNDARDMVNGGEHKKRYRIQLTEREWEAIMAGAISDTQMKRVIRYSDKEELKKRATPRRDTGMKPSSKSRARLLLNAGWSPSAVAEELGVSWNTLAKEFNNFNGMKVGD